MIFTNFINNLNNKLMKTIKTWLATIAVLLYSISASAYDFKVDGIYYNKTSDTTVAVTNGESPYDNPGDYSGDIFIHEFVEYEGITYSVTSIGDYAFYYCHDLTSVNIPNGVTSIGEHVFYGCSDLTSVTIPNSVTSIGDWSFYNCEKLTSANIPNSVTSIGESAFFRCTSLPVIDNIRYAGTYLVEATDKTLSTYTIKAGTRFIGQSAFSECSALNSVIIPNSVISIKKNAFYRCSALASVTIGNNVTSIGDNSFESCTRLKSITIPNNVTRIGESAFYLCNEMTYVIIGNSMTTIGDYAFYDCINLKKVFNESRLHITKGSKAYGYVGYNADIIFNNTKPELIDNYIFGSNEDEYALFAYLGTETTLILPDKYKNQNYKIEDYAFSSNNTLSSVVIPNSVTSIGNYAFYGCKYLTSASIGNSVASIGERAFCGCDGLTSVTIPNSVTCIGNYAFYSCKYLTSVSIGNSVASIGSYAFSGCGLTSLTLPNSVINISDRAFSFCYELISIVIGNSVEKIGQNAFYGCKKILDVYCYAKNLPDTDIGAFGGSSVANATLHVPTSSIENYTVTEPWSNFGKIVALTEEETGIEELRGENEKQEANVYDLSGRRMQNAKKGIYIQNGKKVIY